MTYTAVVNSVGLSRCGRGSGTYEASGCAAESNRINRRGRRSGSAGRTAHAGGVMDAQG
jgi:hypothetical protein